MNFAGAFLTTAVAKTVGEGLIDTNLATLQTLLAALLGAIAWNLVTWYYGLPSSSSHALVGGLIGAALAQCGSSGVLWHGVAHKVVIPAVLAPAIAFAAAFVLLVALYWVFKWVSPGPGNRGLPPRPDRVQRVGLVQPRRERRAEDDGDHRARARAQRTAIRRTSPSRRG